MIAKEKAIEIISKINGQLITVEDWSKASDYAKKDLKRKGLIVANEVLSIRYLLKKETWFYKEVKKEIEKL
jgi:hypothetical protein